MKILAIQPFLRGYTVFPVAGGKDKAALEIGRALVRAGHQLDLLPLPWGIESRNVEIIGQSQPVLLSPDGLQARVRPTIVFPSATEMRTLLWRFLTRKRSYRFPAVSARELIWNNLPNKRRSVARLLQEEHPDVIVVHQSGSDVPVIARECGYRGPLVLVHHSAGLSAFVTHYDHVIFVSALQRDTALVRYPQLRERSSVIYYFADPEYFVPVDPAPRREVTFIGILDSNRKGLDLVLQAFAHDPRLREVTLNVIGEGPLRAKWEADARARNLPVRFYGRVSHAENAAILARSGAYVMPSRGEGLALVYLEALAMGVPIVGFPPNVREIESVLGRPVGCAFHADVDPVSQLAEHIVMLTSEASSLTRTDRREISAAVRARFSLETFHRHYTEFFHRFEKTQGNP